VQNQKEQVNHAVNQPWHAAAAGFMVGKVQAGQSRQASGQNRLFNSVKMSAYYCAKPRN